MPQRDAFSLLFRDEFGDGPLFKNQVDFVTGLLTHPSSDYYFDPNNRDGYQKAFSRTKTLVSQLFSEHSRRCVSLEFSRSLEILLEEKSRVLNFDVVPVFHQIVDDLKEKNVPQRDRMGARKEDDLYDELTHKIAAADVITVFTAREITIELKLGDKKVPIKDFLIRELFSSLQNGIETKRFRFNFPLEQTCILFWKGLREEIANYLFTNDSDISFVLALLNGPTVQTGPSEIASALLQHLSQKNIISVYWLKAPVYLTSVLLLQSRQRNSSSDIYLFLKTAGNQEQIYRMCDQEILLSKLFVWDSLKLSGQGDLVEYSCDF